MSAIITPVSDGIPEDPSAGSTAVGQRSSPYWMALYTMSRHEKTVARYLQREGLEQYLPLIKSRRAWRNRTRVDLELPLFQCYVFARVPAEDSWLVERAPGVIHAIRVGHQPAVVDDAEIEALRHGIAERNAQPHSSLIIGAKARILCGAFAGREGILVRREPGFRVVLTLHNVGLRFSVEVNGDELEIIG